MTRDRTATEIPVNAWLLAAIVLQLGLLICGFVCLRCELVESIVAMEMSSIIGVMSIAVLAEAVGRPAWFDLALALALLSLPAGLLFLVFLERWR
jgi:multisubunit Na+/H+ antiporter MnhF subunit